MSTQQINPAHESLVECVVNAIGKRSFLKIVNKLFGETATNKRKVRTKREIPADMCCMARVKGEKTGIKAGKYVLYDSIRCDRRIIDNSLCAIHLNQQEKKGELVYGLYSEELTDEQKKVFGDV